jgi:hypothetical protein
MSLDNPQCQYRLIPTKPSSEPMATSLPIIGLEVSTENDCWRALRQLQGKTLQR